MIENLIFALSQAFGQVVGLVGGGLQNILGAAETLSSHVF